MSAGNRRRFWIAVSIGLMGSAFGPAALARHIETDTPDYCNDASPCATAFTSSTGTWTDPDNTALTLTFAPGTSFTTLYSMSAPGNDVITPPNLSVQTAYMFNWYSSKPQSNDGDGLQPNIVEQVLILTLSNGQVAVDFNYNYFLGPPVQPCPAGSNSETGSFTWSNTKLNFGGAYAQANPCLVSFNDQDNSDTFLLNSNGTVASTIWGKTSAPEPGTLGLFALGLAGLTLPMGLPRKRMRARVGAQ
jgi:hypothetical protein